MQWVEALRLMIEQRWLEDSLSRVFIHVFFFTFFSKFFSSLKFFLVLNILLIFKHILKIFKTEKAVEIVVTSQYAISLRAGGALTDLK